MATHSGFFQNAFVVDDMDRAIHAWLDAGAGPFFVIPHVRLDHYEYRGAPATIDFSVAMGQAGPIQIELIAQHDDQPSHYRDSISRGESGFHHMCRFARDFDAEMAEFAAAGVPVAGQGLSGDMRFAYLDTRPTIGLMTEIIEDRASIRGLIDLVAGSAIDWDGQDPIRTLG